MCIPNGAELPTFVNQRHDLLLTQAVVERLQQLYSHHRVSKSRNRHFTAQKDTHVSVALHTNTHTHARIVPKNVQDKPLTLISTRKEWPIIV